MRTTIALQDLVYDMLMEFKKCCDATWLLHRVKLNEAPGRNLPVGQVLLDKLRQLRYCTCTCTVLHLLHCQSVL